jgi:hypothetical protein
MKRFQTKNSNRKLVCTANVSPQGEILNLTCQDSPQVSAPRRLVKAAAPNGLPTGRYEEAWKNWENGLKNDAVTIKNSTIQPADAFSVTIGPNVVLPAIPCTGLFIGGPGYYTLPDDQVYSPCGTSPAITIASSDVTLDLSGYTLSQVDKSVSGIVGIFVQPNVQNITIKNGTVELFSASGLLIGDFSGSVTNVNILNINSYLNGDQSLVYTFFTQTGGMGMLNCKNTVIEDSNFNQNVGNGMAAAFCTNLTINNCHFDQNTWCNQQFFLGHVDPSQNWAFAWGAVILFGNDVKITNSTFNDTSSQKSSNGIVLAFGSRTVIDSCTFQNINVWLDDPNVINSGDHIEVFGSHLEGQSQSTINNCQSHNCGGILNLPYGKDLFSVHHFITGFSTYNPDIYTVTNSDAGGQYFVNNTNEPQYCNNSNYLTFIGNRVYYGNCRSRGNNNYDGNASDLFVGGWYLAYSDNTHLLEDCSSVGHSQYVQNPLDEPGSVFSITSGFHAETKGSVIFRRCTALNNTNTFDGQNGGIAAGFDTLGFEYPGFDTPTGFVFEDCISENNTASNGQGAGFYMTNLIDSKIIDCKTEGNDIGIFLQDYNDTDVPGPSGNNIISDNTLSANNHYGILDKTLLSYTNAYYRNVAKNNGVTPAVCPNDSNYNNGFETIQTAPIYFWHLSQQVNKKEKCKGSHPLDNISIN